MKKVMLVEDEEFILQGLLNIIDWNSLHMEVTGMAHNGQEALELYEKEPVDIVVTDITMPVMDGLQFIENLRKKDERVRCIILTGYDDFGYARTAIRLDVENYILKPIDEVELERALLDSVEKLDKLDRQKIAHVNEKVTLVQLLNGKLEEGAAREYLRSIGFAQTRKCLYTAFMKIDGDSLGDVQVSEVILYLQSICEQMRVFHIPSEGLLLILQSDTEDIRIAREFFREMQDETESHYNILTFVSVGCPVYDTKDLPESYRVAQKLQRYLMIDGYGGCVDTSYVENRTSSDVNLNTSLLQKLICKKDKEGAVNYLEDLFINNARTDVTVDTLYQMAIKIALFLTGVKEEYKLTEEKELRDLSDIIDGIYRAENVYEIKAVFISEIIGIINHLHEEDSQYTPVIRQIMAEVQNNYMEDMNLKTLAYKYHMNTSYLGQIFLKEVGCSFSQYLSNTKNSIAKDLILNTNMKINDIAKAVGYPDTSYFYRKFKQCYGVSPASLRDMKKY